MASAGFERIPSGKKEGVATPATPSHRVRGGGYRFFFSRWLSAEPAADLDAFDVRPSRSTLEAAFAAFAPVTFFANFTTSVPGPECEGPGAPPRTGDSEESRGAARGLFREVTNLGNRSPSA